MSLNGLDNATVKEAHDAAVSEPGGCYSSYPYGKPKVKLAPRPSLDTSGRPRTSAGTGSRKGKGDAKLSGSSTEQIDEEDKGDDATFIVTKVAAISVPANPPETLDVHRPHTSGGRPASSSGISIKSTATTTATTVTKQNTMTPEKARLMKAMKLREKKKKMTIQPPIPIPTVDISEAPTEEVVGSILQPEEPSNRAPATGVSYTENFEDLPNIDRLSSGNNFTSGAGSGETAVDTGLPAALDQISIETHTTDSHPASPLAMSSEIGDSTKASSLSESTDETVQALRDLKVETGVTSHHDSTSPGNPTATIESSEPLYHGGGTESDKSRAEGHGSVSSGPVVQSEELPGYGMAEHDADDGVFLGEDQPVTSKSYLDKAAAFNSAPVLESADALVFAERTARAPIDEVGIEFTDSSRPTTSTTSEFTADLEDETLVPSTMVPVITAPEPRDSQSTIGLETSDTASMDTKRARRRALVDPIQTNLGGGLENDGARSDANLSDDDELMEELQSATVQQAKPMTVSKSPITPVFPNTSPSKHRVAGDEVFGRVARTVSSPVRGSLLVPGDASAGAARSVSSNATFLQKITQQKASNIAPKKTNLGSSISQRIKALEKLSGGTPEISGLSVAGSSTETERKKESILERRASKEKRRSQSQDRSTIADGSEDTRPRRRSSLSIVKDFIKDRRGSVMASRSPSTDNLNTTNLASPASLFSHSKSPSRPPSVHTTHGLARRLSISSRRSTSKDRDMITPPTNTPLSPSLMTETSGSGDESKSFTSELGHKKTSSGGKNRASRFIRRLSSSLTTGRKSTTPTISPTVAEEEEASSTTAAPNQGDLVIQSNAISCVGDVNVQFPDNLLWKRRTMCLDSQGFLILSTGNSVGAPGIDKPAGTVKRYHISDFRLPYIPEMEMQELPNSVCLDFVDGSGLQIACEDRAGQLNILHVLQDAHQGHTSFGQ
ncbi:GPI-anchored cell surface protein [Sporothrix brasiliensis 5110]|uniref:GPI-anchored cell surface protein n=1 Tax=Sporothrix brasiliensis 5110 TaxID=1398154 RepID=A0A0C2IQ74_9PEZI|nr:GPI-anchored cell surface protein [Sporothrix brasiliensis 5110]KIH87202.1 GPI-anchored cell surface protein [Sporothrix brasiliensis 5110]